MNNKLLLCLLFVCTLFCSCDKDPMSPNYILTVKALPCTNIERTSVVLNGQFECSNPKSVTNYGFRVGLTTDIDDSLYKDVEVKENNDSTFTTSLSSLEIGKTYFYVAYVSNGTEEVVSEIESFTTPLKSGAKLSQPTASVNDDYDIVLNSSVVDDGGSVVTTVGFCWSTNNPKPTIEYSHVSATLSSTNFSATTDKLEEVKRYYIRAYANNGVTSGTQTYSYSETLEYTVPDNAIYIPDEKFKSYLLSHFDTNRNREISHRELTKITDIYVSSRDIESLRGIELMPNLTILDCADNQLHGLDISKNPKLTQLICSDNQIISLDISQNTKLTKLSCEDNYFNYVKVWKGFKIDNIRATYDNVVYFTSGPHPRIPDPNFRAYLIENFDSDNDGEISIIEAETITKISINNCKIASLEGIEHMVNLTSLSCADNHQLTSLDISKNTALTSLDCSGNPLTIFDLSENSELTVLNCSFNQLTSLDLSKNTQLKKLTCTFNDITVLDLSNNTKLTDLTCDNNPLTSLDMSKNTQLQYLDCSFSIITSLIIYKNTELTKLWCNYNQLTTLDISKNTQLEDFRCEDNPNLYNIFVWNGFDLSHIRATYDHGTLFVAGDFKPSDPEIINIPDHNFKFYLIENYDINHDGCISDSEAQAITSISVESKDIASLEGIEYMVNLTALYCSTNQLTSLDLSKNTRLSSLVCDNNQLTSLDLSKNTQLTELDCSDNQLTSLDLFKNTQLTSLYCTKNQLTSLDLSKNTRLSNLVCDKNQLTLLDVSGCEKLTKLHCLFNSLTLLDVSKNSELTELDCSDNQSTSLDLSKNTRLSNLVCDNNQLTLLDVSGCVQLTKLHCLANSLTLLDISKNSELTELYCSDNQLTSLDLSRNTQLKYAWCVNNKLTSLDLPESKLLQDLHCYNNPELYNIYVWDGFNEYDFRVLDKDSQASFVKK